VRFLDYQRVREAERTKAAELFGTDKEPTALASKVPAPPPSPPPQTKQHTNNSSTRSSTSNLEPLTLLILLLPAPQMAQRQTAAVAFA